MIEDGRLDLRRPYLIKVGADEVASIIKDPDLRQKLNYFETTFKKQQGTKNNGRGLAVLPSVALEKWIKGMLPKKPQEAKDAVVEVKIDVHGAKIGDEVRLDAHSHKL